MALNRNCITSHPSSALSKERGFSLLEVLVSVVVLAIGLLGLASLQTNVIKFNHSAYLRSVAIYQAQNIVERMRANKDAIENNKYSGVTVKTPPSCTTCTSSEQAQLDIYTWTEANKRLLPAGQGTITSAGEIYTITVMWDNDRTGATGTGCGGNSKVDLTCLRMEVEL